MIASTLYYSRAKLFKLGFISVMLGFGAIPIGYALTGDEGFEKLHTGFILYAFGRDGPRIFMLLFGLLFALAGLATFRRLAGDRAAATIRLDGLRLFGLLRVRTIPWRYLESVSLLAMRAHGKVRRTMVVRSRRLPGEGWLSHFLGRRFTLLADRLDATPDEILSWAQAAETARRQALLQRADQPPWPSPGVFGHLT
jgi:hypothetical protein